MQIPLIPNYLNQDINLNESASKEKPRAIQIANQYILSSLKNGYILIHQQAAHERILYEKYLAALQAQKMPSQKLLFPSQIQLNMPDAEILRELLEDINLLGFEIMPFGANDFVIHGIPADLTIINETELIEEFLEQFRNNMGIVKLSKRESLISSLAAKAAIKAGKTLSPEEMNALIDQLFACENPYTTMRLQKTFIQYDIESIDKAFQ